MAISKIRITNFKSFKKLEVELGDLSVLIGANASGKSNFVQIFQFLRDTINHNLDNAISMQGGVEFLRNINIGPSDNLSVNIVSDENFGFIIRKTKELMALETHESIYEFSLKFNRSRLGFEIVLDKLIQKCVVHRMERKKKRLKKKEKVGEGNIIFSRINGKVKLDITGQLKRLIKEGDILPLPYIERELSPSDLILENPFYFPPPLREIFTDLSIYDFDPKLPKKATPITGKLELEENGENLSIVLKNIIEDKERKRKFSNLMSELLPFIIDFDIEKFADKSLFFKLQEKYFKKLYLPASLISDGTINITGLIIALYFEKKPLTIIEEPERNIHPYLISKVLDMMKDASREKQIIITTHNPEIVKHAGLENILLISRDKEGFSTISRPANKEEVKTFLTNEIGIEELYVKNLLEV